MSKMVRAKYEKGVLRPLDSLGEIREGEVLLVKIMGRDVADEVFGSIKVDKERLEKVLRELDDELGLY